MIHQAADRAPVSPKGFVAYRYPLHQILSAEEWSS
jgi:hypothetical protein